MAALVKNASKKLVLRRRGVTLEGWLQGRAHADEAQRRREVEAHFGLAPGELDGLAVDETDDAVVVRPWATWG